LGKTIKSKRGDEVTDVFFQILKKAKPVKIKFDDGKEFYNKHFKELLEKNNIDN
jgi:hypothetical protein